MEEEPNYIEQLLANVINGQQANSKQLKELLSMLQNELNELKNQKGDTIAVQELKQLILQQTSEIEALKQKKPVIDLTKIANQEPTKSITIFGGNNAQVTYKRALMFFGFVLFSYFGFKYIPSYLNESNRQDEEHLMTKRFVEYSRLTQFQEKGNTEEIDDFIQMIYSSDSLFVNKYNTLSKAYRKEQQRIQLEKEKNNLDQQLKDLK